MCDCGHDLDREHDGQGCFAILVKKETDQQPSMSICNCKVKGGAR